MGRSAAETQVHRGKDTMAIGTKNGVTADRRGGHNS